MTSRSLLGGIVFILLGIALFIYSNWQSNIDNSDILFKYPNFEANNFETVIFNKEGVINYEMQARNVQYYKKRDFIMLTSPVVKIFDKERDGGYIISSDIAILEQGIKGKLDGNTTLRPLNNSSIFDLIKTHTVYINTQERSLKSDDKISIEGANFYNEGLGFEGDLKQKTFKIKGNPHATYQP